MSYRYARLSLLLWPIVVGILAFLYPFVFPCSGFTIGGCAFGLVFLGFLALQTIGIYAALTFWYARWRKRNGRSPQPVVILGIVWISVVPFLYEYLWLTGLTDLFHFIIDNPAVSSVLDSMYLVCLERSFTDRLTCIPYDIVTYLTGRVF